MMKYEIPNIWNPNHQSAPAIKEFALETMMAMVHFLRWP